MKELLMFFVAVPMLTFGQLVEVKFYPEYRDNPLVQDVPHRDVATVDMSFIEDKQTSMIISELTLINSYLHDKIELVSIDSYMY